MPWDPDRYEAFLGERLQPGLDLLHRIPDHGYRSIVDLGCGTGRLTSILADRWPPARIEGVDRDPAMLEAARRSDQRIRWTEADLESWQPPEPVDLIVSNSALHWADDHDALLPSLVGWLTPGGVLAIQMPHNHDRPSHTAIAAEVDDPRWRDRLRPVWRDRPVWDAEAYLDLLRRAGTVVEAWETDYLHRLDGSVLDWVEGSVLRPLLEQLTPEEQAELRSRLSVAYRRAYPPDPDGTTRLRFRRLFLVARRTTGHEEPGGLSPLDLR